MAFLENFSKRWKMSKEVLGMNARNLLYIRPYNRKKAKRIADDKIKTKRKLKKNNIPVSKTFASIKKIEDMDTFNWDNLPSSFVMKPAHGFGGGGIIVSYNKNKRDNWVGINGKDIVKEELIAHAYNILDGEFALANLPDEVLFEERIKIHKTFKAYSYKGLPDVRLIIFNNVPIMAMLRLPTKISNGRGNISQGALGVGIDLATGVTTTAIERNVVTHMDKMVDYHPENGLPLSGISIPFWKEILEIGIKCQQISNLGYLGVDIAIDKERGPLVMELNARPGLSIQNCNNEGLRGRLRRVSGLKVNSIKKGIRLAKDLFGGEIEEGVEEATGKKVIKSKEEITIIGKDGIKIEKMPVRIDTGAASSSICVELAEKLGYKEAIDNFNKINFNNYYKENISSTNIKRQKEVKFEIMKEYGNKIPELEEVSTVFSASGFTIRPVIKITYIMDNEKVSSDVNVVDRSGLKYQMLIGRKDLKRRFLVEVNEV